MKKQIALKKSTVLRLDKNYLKFFNDIKEKLKTTQISAALAANKELIKFYWSLGSTLIEKQTAFRWGEHFLEQFSHDMRQNFQKCKVFQFEIFKE